jgi:hypothetical protein
MKKVILVAALSLGTMTVFAQEVETAIEAVEETATEVVEEAATEAVEAATTEAVEETATEAVVEEVATEEAVEEVAAKSATEAAMDAVAAVGEAQQDGYTEVAIEELPASISEALATDYPTATISMAYVNEAAQYKLEIANEDGTTAELFADAEGNWIEM